MPLVIDAGTSYIKVGFSGDDAPRGLFPSVVGHGSENPAVGDEAVSHRDNLELTHPIENGHVTSWNDMEKILNYAFYKVLQQAPEEHPILLAESVFNSKQNREKAAQMLFEIFNAPSIYIIPDAVLSLYQSGRTTGVVIDIGSTSTRVVPIVEGKCVSNAVSHVDIGGEHVTSYLQQQLGGTFYARDQFELREILQNMKAQLCFVAGDFDEISTYADTSSDIDTEYNLPDGETITLGADRFRAPEVLFRPDMLGLNFAGIHTAVVNSIGQCPGNVQETLYSNIVLSGGTALLPGMRERFSIELAGLAGRSVEVAAPANAYTAWLGGTIVASSSSFEGLWLSKEGYDESGPAIVNTKWA
ncbi:actin [Aspergillus wentii]|nr:actin [Aspergillus wentii]